MKISISQETAARMVGSIPLQQLREQGGAVTLRYGVELRIEYGEFRLLGDRVDDVIIAHRRGESVIGASLLLF